MEQQLEPHWDIGEEGAVRRFKDFIDKGIAFYKEGKYSVKTLCISFLSPHLIWRGIT